MGKRKLKIKVALIVISILFILLGCTSTRINEQGAKEYFLDIENNRMVGETEEDDITIDPNDFWSCFDLEGIVYVRGRMVILKAIEEGE